MDQDTLIINNQDIIHFFKSNKIDLEDFLLSIIKPLKLSIVNSDKIDYNVLLEKVATSISTQQVNLYSQINNQLFSINQNVNSFIQLQKISSKKGEFTENNYYFKLIEALPTYSISNVSSIPHSMDILIQHPNFPDIRLDIKEYSSNVPTKEIIKFHQDILFNKCHGILISDSSGITGHQNFTFEIIQNAYIAFYLSNNSLNIDNVTNIIQFIYSIDSILTKHSECSLTIKQVNEINSILSNNQLYISQIKDNLNNSIQLCNKFSLDSIENILKISSKSMEIEYVCRFCSRQFTTEKRLNNHIIKCQSKSL